MIAQRHPPTPPTLGDYQPPLQVQQYDVDRAYPYDDLSYGSPVVVAHEGIPSQVSHGGNLCREGFGLGIQYAGYGSIPTVFHDGQYVERSQDAFSPPTPRSTTEDEIAVRSSISEKSAKEASCSPQLKIENRVDSARVDSVRVKATPRVRKARSKAKNDKPKTPKLTAPLSVLTRDHPVAIKDMESWVNRSKEVRQDEAEKRDGYVTRPMNSFMLYRSAYADRAKSWCRENNHQVVSSIAGESWPLEPPEVREQYNQYAKIERLNHHAAHPDYKFSPSKTAAPKRLRKQEWSADEDEASDCEDKWGNPRRRHKFNRSISYASNNGTSLEQPYADRYTLNRSWEVTGEGRPMPMAAQNEMYSYYPAPVYTSMYPASYPEDVSLRRVEAPTSTLQFSSNQALLGLPGGNDLMQQMHGEQYESHQVDPLLLAYEGGHPEMAHGYHSSQSGMGDQQSIEGLMEMRAHEYNNSWHSDPNVMPESEFDKWVSEH